MKEFLEPFCEYMTEERGASRNTLQAYLRDLHGLLAFLYERDICAPEQVSPAELALYISSLAAGGKSAATISRNAASIRIFFSWLCRQGVLVRDPSERLRAPKVVKKLPSVLKDEEVERLLLAPDPKTPKGIRDRAMLALLCATGLRVSELCGLRLGDADQHGRVLLIEKPKMRLVPYDKKCARCLGKYLGGARSALSAGKDCDALFLNCQGGRMSRQGFWKLMKKYGADAKICTELTPHVIRHSFAVYALRRGADIEKLQDILGHSDAATTSGYLEVLRAAGYALSEEK